MGISFECGHCGKTFDVGVEFAGRTGRCKRCGVALAIPQASAPPPEPGPVVIDLDDPLPPPPVAPYRPATAPDRSTPRPNVPPASSWGRVGKTAGFIVLGLLIVGRAYTLVRSVAPKPPMTPERARQAMQADMARFATGPIALPRFPDLGAGVQRPPGVMFHEVVFGPASSAQPLDAMPGQGGKLWVYLPTGPHAPRSLPCVLIAGAGSNLLTGMELGDGDRAEHLPYVAAGFAVVAFELDGMNRDMQGGSDLKMTEAMYRFEKARAGLVNAHIALEYALARVPEIDPGRISAVGHSSAGALAVLFAENEPRLKSCVAFAPALDYAKRFDADTMRLVQTAGFAPLVTTYSPITQVARLNGPLLLFHARDDSNEPVARNEAFAARARALGKAVTLDLVNTGDHYESMIRQGIPHAIAWLQGQPIPPAGSARPPQDEPAAPTFTPAPSHLRPELYPQAPGQQAKRPGPSAQDRERLEALKKRAEERRRAMNREAGPGTPP